MKVVENRVGERGGGEGRGGGGNEREAQAQILTCSRPDSQTLTCSKSLRKKGE